MAAYTVFVFGSLKRTQPNHRLMDNEENGVAKFLGRGHTVSKYPLVIASVYNVPFVLYKEGSGKVVHGELYEVDEKMLTALDQLENHPHFYQRDLVQVVMTENEMGQVPPVEKQCWMYFLKRYKPELLELPCYESYDSRGDHGLAFVENRPEGFLEILMQNVMSD